MGQTRQFICSYCGREFGNQGSLNLHKKACEVKSLKAKLKAYKDKYGELSFTSGKQKEPSKDPIRDTLDYCKVCKSPLKVLNPNITSHARAINQGYTELCANEGCKMLY